VRDIIKIYIIAIGTAGRSPSYVILIGANLCVRCTLEVKGKGIRGLRGVADKEAKMFFFEFYLPAAVFYSLLAQFLCP
jgi:hypothetical protein